jgi:hypothetical protein
MFLKNYTSAVPVATTIARIEKALIHCKVSGITKEYGPAGEISALQFHIKLDAANKALSIRLPADPEGALQALWLDYIGEDKLDLTGERMAWNSRKRKEKSDFRALAEQTAWRLMQDWVEVQLSMIQMKQADLAEVFMAYVWDGRQTFYQAIKENGYRALLADTSGKPGP